MKHMIKGVKFMKALIVENKKAYYHKKNEGEIVKEPITNISSEDIKNLILYILKHDDIELCEPCENVEIVNKAEKIIYDNLSKKINNLIENKNKIVNDIEKNFNTMVSKYKTEDSDD